MTHEEVLSLTKEDEQFKSDWLDGYDAGVQRCMEILEDFKEKHSNDRKKYPINYGTLLDLEMAFYKSMQIESK